MVVFHSFWRLFRKLGRTVVGWVNLEESNHGTHRKHGREETPRSPPPRERPGRRLTAESAEPAAKKMRMGTDRSDDGPRKARKPRKGTDGVPPWSGPRSISVEDLVRAARNATLPTGIPARFRAFRVLRGPSSDRSVHTLPRLCPSGLGANCGRHASPSPRRGGCREVSKKVGRRRSGSSSFLVCSAVRRPLERFVPRPGCVPGDERLCVRIFIAWVISVGGAASRDIDGRRGP